jgi:shikimate dehydrogenase
MMISGKTGLLGVIGNPIGHSLSPVMHNAALREMNSDFVYVAFPIQESVLSTAIAGFGAIGVQGFSVTIPHKQAIMAELVEISELAQAVGAVNTVWKTKAGWSGTNTDVEGFVSPLKEMNQDWGEKTAIVLGNGGAARAVVSGCAELGFKQIQVIGRDNHKLQEFLTSFNAFQSVASRLTVQTWDTLDDAIANADLIVNSTPIGMAPKTDASPLTTMQAQQIKPGTIAYDLIYTPNPTEFLKQAMVQGGIAIDGLEMLVQQGAAALKIWTGQSEVPVATMRTALQAHLGLI